MEMEAPGIDPGTSRMLSERSTIWATPPNTKYLTNCTISKVYRNDTTLITYHIKRLFCLGHFICASTYLEQVCHHVKPKREFW